MASVLDAKSISTVKTIHRETYGRIFEINYEGTPCAAKEVSLKHVDMYSSQIEKLKTDFLRECNMWNALHHPNIVQFLGIRAHD